MARICAMRARARAFFEPGQHRLVELAWRPTRAIPARAGARRRCAPPCCRAAINRLSMLKPAICAMTVSPRCMILDDFETAVAPLRARRIAARAVQRRERRNDLGAGDTHRLAEAAPNPTARYLAGSVPPALLQCVEQQHDGAIPVQIESDALRHVGKDAIDFARRPCPSARPPVSAAKRRRCLHRPSAWWSPRRGCRNPAELAQSCRRSQPMVGFPDPARSPWPRVRRRLGAAGSVPWTAKLDEAKRRGGERGGIARRAKACAASARQRLISVGPRSPRRRPCGRRQRRQRAPNAYTPARAPAGIA